jgi:hypothetical protein
MPRRQTQATRRPIQPRTQRFTRQQPAARFAPPTARAVPRKLPPQHGRGR